MQLRLLLLRYCNLLFATSTTVAGSLQLAATTTALQLLLRYSYCGTTCAEATGLDPGNGEATGPTLGVSPDSQLQFGPALLVRETIIARVGGGRL